MTDDLKRLYGLGFALIWLRPNSKIPVEKGWTKGERVSWEKLAETRPLKCNFGVRLGNASRLKDGTYLGVIDCDVKSSEPKHVKEMLDRLDELWLNGAPTVMSGRANGSRHLYVRSKTPLAPRRVAQAGTKVRVKMPSVKPSKAERGVLTEKELREGWRLRAAWEISIMGEGQQVVLPPSVHPDTGRRYEWLGGGLGGLKAIPLFQDAGKVEGPKKEVDLKGMTFEKVDVYSLGLPTRIVDLIVSGEGSCGDLSTDLFKVCIVMVNRRIPDEVVLSVCTDPDNFISECARSRRGSLASQREWVLKYTISKVRASELAREAFADAAAETSEDATDVVLKDEDWKDRIEKSGKDGKGPPKGTLENVILILTHGVSRELFKRDTFVYRDFYGCDTPWGSKAGKALTDEDVAHIRYWLGQRYNFEPGKEIICDAMIVIASQNSFDPVRESLEALPPWDEVERLDTWLKDHFEARGNAEYIAQVFRKWMVAMVKRVFEPGAKFDWMPIFEGVQGAGKSSFGRLLVGDQYFLDWLPDFKDKDAALGLQGTWGVEMAELATLTKREVEPAKAFLTRTLDKVRPPYGKRWIESPRRAVFFGTTNKEHYLVDESGNRRFKPLRVGQLDFKALARDRDQLFAEALWIYKMGLEDEISLNVFDGEARIYEIEIQNKKLVEDDSTMMADLLQDFFEEDKKKPENERLDRTKIKLSDLFELPNQVTGPLRKWRFENRNLQFAAKAMRKLGAEKFIVNGRSFWRFERKPLKITKEVIGQR